jgi:uncharacterized protein (TIGR03663 family)
MHTDEAVHAIKFGDLLEHGRYQYDPFEYHGPTLNYLSLIPAWLTAKSKLTDIDEWHLRIVPVVFGLLLVVIPLPLVGTLGRTAVFFAMLLTATSPAMVYYSRYYIMEVMLVFFTAGMIVAGYGYLKHPRMLWAVVCGVFAGLMHATKETCILAFGAMSVALAVTILHERRFEHDRTILFRRFKLFHLLIGLVCAFAVSALFFSSFFSNPKGILDSVLTYTTYVERAGYNDIHIHPWYYYLKMLFWSHYEDGRVWSEAPVILLAAVGCYSASGKGARSYDHLFVRFLTIYTILMLIVYSAIPYKTPWNLLSFYHGMILLAGIGAVEILKYRTLSWSRVVATLMVGFSTLHLVWQAWLASFRDYENSTNPYVYAHTVSDIFPLIDKVHAYARMSGVGSELYIEVICPGGDYWPLPWYLRDLKNVAWRTSVDDSTRAAPLIVASPGFEGELLHKLYDLPPPGEKYMYLPMLDDVTYLRPRVELRGYVRKDLWDILYYSDVESDH